MISRDIGEEALTTIAPGTTGIPFGTRVTAAPLPPKPLSKTTIGVLGTGTFGVGAAPIIPSLIPQSKTTTLPTRPMISRDIAEEDLNIPVPPEPDIPNITIPEPDIPNITIPEINVPNIDTASDPFEEVGGGYGGKSTELDTELSTDTDKFTPPDIDYWRDTDTELSTDTDKDTNTEFQPLPIRQKDPFAKYGFGSDPFAGKGLSDPFANVGGGYGGITSMDDDVSTPPPTTPKPTTPPPTTPKLTRGDRTRKRFRSRRSGNKSDFDKRKSAALPYPSKVQYKEKDKYVTFNLNTNKKKVFNTPQGIGVNPGTTPEDTLKVIQKQKTKPKFKKYKLGNLVLSVTSPETIVIRRLRAFRNNKTNKRFRR